MLSYLQFYIGATIMVPMSQFCEGVTGVTRVWPPRHTYRDCASPVPVNNGNRVILILTWSRTFHLRKPLNTLTFRNQYSASIITITLLNVLTKFLKTVRDKSMRSAACVQHSTTIGGTAPHVHTSSKKEICALMLQKKFTRLPLFTGTAVTCRK